MSIFASMSLAFFGEHGRGWTGEVLMVEKRHVHYVTSITSYTRDRVGGREVGGGRGVKGFEVEKSFFFFLSEQRGRRDGKERKGKEGKG